MHILLENKNESVPQQMDVCVIFVSAPLFFDAFKPNCGYNRGCNRGAFCDFDYGLTGFCESCEDYSSVWDCNNNDFTPAGATECIARCSKNFSKIGIALDLFDFAAGLF